MCLLPVVWAITCLGGAPLRASDEAVAALRATATKLYSDRAYQQAHEAWMKLAKSGISGNDRPKVEFFMADSLWRSQPGPERVDEARRLLEAIAQAHPDSSLGAEAWESLADSWLANDRDWPRAWEAYQNALAIWAVSEDVDLARDRYLAIVWKATGPPGESNRVTLLPLDVLTNALRIAKSDENIARARFFLGLWLADQADSFSIRRAGSEWSQVIAMGAGTAVYESALFELAMWSLVAGSSEWKPDGSLELMPNFQRAYGLFRRLLNEFPDSRYGADASARLAELTHGEMSLSTEKNYLPGAQPLIIIESRNVTDVDFSLYRVDLNSAFLPTANTEPDEWQRAVTIEKSKPIRQWKQSVETVKPFQPARTEMAIEVVNEPGAYILQAVSGGLRTRTLFIVSSVAGMLRASSDQAVVLVCDVGSGQAVPAVEARLWHAERKDGSWEWTVMDAAITSAGLLRFELPKEHSGSAASLVLIARANESPVFLTSYASRALSSPDGWRFQVLTDRSHGHSGAEVGWKLIARKTNAERLVTPVGELVEWRIVAPDGVVASQGEITLNEFGSGWGSFKLAPSLPLGEYTIEFYAKDEWIGESILVRLDEPSEPPFSVDLGLSGQSGRTVRLGETLRMVMRAEYPSGGGVPDALVSVILRESPYQRELAVRSDAGGSFVSGGVSKVIRQDEMRTAPDGSVIIEVQTPPDSPVDLLYDVDVVVRDGSGREVRGSRQFVVARHGYFAEMRVARRMVEPGVSTDVLIRTFDANDTPVSTKGSVVVKREDTVEVWLAPDGREVSGEALDQLRQAQFPPPGEKGWVLKSRGELLVEVSRHEIETDAVGSAVFPFLSGEDGLFRIFWESSDSGGPPVTTETAVWVCDSATQAIAYRGTGLQIIADVASVSADGAVDVLVVTDTPQRNVLLTVGAGQKLFSADLIHVPGNARLVRLPSDPRFAPNVFLQASTIRGGEFFSDTAEVRFANWANRLDLDFVDLQKRLTPGANTTLQTRVQNASGEPERAELALAVVSKSADPDWVANLQNALDVFHGGLRAQGGTLVSSLSESKTIFGTEGTRELEQTRLTDGQANPSADLSQFPSERGTADSVALWRPGLRSGAMGQVSADLILPKTPTRLRVAAWAVSRGESFGFATASVDAMPPLLTQFFTPGFLVRGDESFIRATVRNETSTTQRLRAELTATHLRVDDSVQDSRVNAGGEADFEWPIGATKPGTSAVDLDVQSGDQRYPLKQSLPVLSRGSEVVLSAAGIVRGDGIEVAMELPADHDPGSSDLKVEVSKSLESALADALPSMMNSDPINIDEVVARFVPVVLMQSAIAASGLGESQIASRTSALSSRLSDAAEDGIEALSVTGLKAVYDQQNAEGGWAWVVGAKPDPWTTAYVVWSLRLAQISGVGIREDKLEAAVKWLQSMLRDENLSPSAKAWLLHAVGCIQSSPRKPAKDEAAALDELWNLKDKLPADAVAFFAIASKQFGQNQRASTLIELLGKMAVTDIGAEGQMTSASWAPSPEIPSLLNATEVTSFALMAMTAIDPANPLIAGAEAALMQARKGLLWGNPRTSTVAAAALTPLVKFSPEETQEGVDLSVNGEKVILSEPGTLGSKKSESAGFTPSLKSGRNVITLRRKGERRPFYYAITLSYFTDAPPSVPDEAGFSVVRNYYKLDAFETLLDGWRYEKSLWKLGDSVRLNSRVEAEITIQSEGTTRYVRLTDRLAAGFEPVDIQPGQLVTAENEAGDVISALADVRDQEVIFQFPELPAGVWKLRYQLRAKLEGSFFGPPAVITTPLLDSAFARSASWQVTIAP